jgi:hypothetical protein
MLLSKLVLLSEIGGPFPPGFGVIARVNFKLVLADFNLSPGGWMFGGAGGVVKNLLNPSHLPSQDPFVLRTCTAVSMGKRSLGRLCLF